MDVFRQKNVVSWEDIVKEFEEATEESIERLRKKYNYRINRFFSCTGVCKVLMQSGRLYNYYDVPYFKVIHGYYFKYFKSDLDAGVLKMHKKRVKHLIYTGTSLPVELINIICEFI